MTKDIKEKLKKTLNEVEKQMAMMFFLDEDVIEEERRNKFKEETDNEQR